MKQTKKLAGFVALLLTCTVTLLFVLALTQPDEAPVTSTRRRLQATEMQDIAPSLLPLGTRDVIAFVLATLGLMIAAGGGIGGGGMLVPIYILVLQFAPKQAIPLSNVTVFGGALANLLLNYSKRHPMVNRPLIDWDLILVMEPLTLSGALFGANLNILMPDLAIVMALALLLSLTGYKTYQKAIKLHQEEVQGWRAIEACDSEEQTEEASECSSTDIEMPVLEIPQVPDTSLQEAGWDSLRPVQYHVDKKLNNQQRGSLEEFVSLTVTDDMTLAYKAYQENGINFELGNEDLVLVQASTEKDTPNPLRKQIIKEESQPRWQSILVIVSLFSFVLLINLLKGGGGAFASPLGIQCGSSGYWILEGLIVAATIGVTLYARSYLLQQSTRRAEAHYKYLGTDIQWNHKSTVLYPVVCTLAGMIAGLFGVGGGLVKAPLLLALGVHPAVASATSATMILFSTSTATTSFVAFGMLVWDYGVLCLVVGFGATLVGQLVMSSLIQRTGKPSYIAFCIAGVVLVSAVTMTAEWVFTLSQRGEGRLHNNFGFCGQE